MAGRDPRRQPRADRHGNAAACCPTPAGRRPFACCWRRGWPAEVLPEIVPADDSQSAAAGRHAGRARAARTPGLPAGPGRLARRTGRRAGAPGGLPPLAALEQRHGAARWLRRASSAPGPAPGDALVGAAAAAGCRGDRRPCGPGRGGPPAGSEAAAYCRSLLAQPREVLDPPPLLTGDDLLAHGVPAGPVSASFCNKSAMPSSTPPSAPRPRRWRWWIGC